MIDRILISNGWWDHWGVVPNGLSREMSLITVQLFLSMLTSCRVPNLLDSIIISCLIGIFLSWWLFFWSGWLEILSLW